MNSSWPMFKHDIRHTGKSSYGPNPLGNWPVVKWKYWMEGQTRSSPAIDENEIIYVGGEDFHNSFFTIYPNGTEKWRFDASHWVDSSPAIAADGTIYFGSHSGYLYALNSNGTKRWQYSLDSVYITSSPAISNDNVYIGSVDSYKLYAINANGTINWTFLAENSIFSSPSLDDLGVIYFGSYDGYLYAIHPNGTLKWKFYAGGSKGVGSSPTIADDGTIYFGSTSGYLYALNPNGTERWKVQTGWISSSPSIGDSGMVYIGDQDYNKIYCIDKNGNIQWYYQTGDEITSSPAIDKNGLIYCGSMDSYLYVLNSNGTLRWKFKAGDEGIESSPIIGEDGTIYIAGNFKPSGGQSSYSYLYSLQIIEDNPPSIPTITGTVNGTVRRTYDYTIVSTDIDNDNISYYIDWGDGRITDWIGPYDSGEEIIQSHTWLLRGLYDIKVKARDGYGMESDWGTLRVTMPFPYDIPFTGFLQRLFERFPNAFPILRTIFYKDL